MPFDRLNLIDVKLKLELATEAFPPCSDVMLALASTGPTDDIVTDFIEYFEFGRHQIIDPSKVAFLPQALRDCVGGGQRPPIPWPPRYCLSPSCVTLNGSRNLLPPVPGGGDPTAFAGLKRLFIADLVWLFFYDRLGIFQILGVILDDFATKGRIPIDGGSIRGGSDRDQVIALILESMVRQTKMGLSSTVRERDSSYRRCTGWTSQTGRKLNLDTSVSTGFNTLFHKFIQSALEFYRDKRLAVAIQTTAAATPPSVSTLITIRDTLDILKKTFETFDYGRNYYHTLSGIVWVIAGMALIKELKATLGIPPVYNQPHEFIPAAYDLLVLKKSASSSETNRYSIHRECARAARALLLDIEVLDQNRADPNQDLDLWLTDVEAKVEGYRTAYRSLTGVDLGAAGTPAIEQQV